ncbi:MAG: hypothetical protein ACOYXT_16980 [Bacteroidota bacterium]
MRIALVFLILLWATIYDYAQVTIPGNYGKLPTVSGPAIPNPLYNLYQSNEDRNRINMQMHEQDVRNYQLQEQRRKQLLKEAYKELGIEEEFNSSAPFNSRVKYSYSPNKHYGKIHFENAFKEITDMIEGRKPYNLKRAVFLTEHAYDTTLNYQRFERQISKLVEIIQLKIKHDKISPDDNMGKILAVFQFMADTIKVFHPALEKTITTYPKLYDFEDFYGIHDYHKMFVTKLVKTGTGQCHSMPLLFLILCQEINAKAYLSFAPEHSYVKFLDKTKTLHNVELTNQMITTDQFILQSGFIRSAAVKSRIYMDTLGMEKVIISTLGDLANSYAKKYGRYDDFTLKLAETVLSRFPNEIVANMHAANYYNMLDYRIKKQYDSLGLGEAQFWADEKFKAVRRSAIMWNDRLDNLGYAEMPPDIYSKWLGLLRNESMRQQYLERKRLLLNMVEYK